VPIDIDLLVNITFRNNQKELGLSIAGEVRSEQKKPNSLDSGAGGYPPDGSND
jgi:hypothetical protein